MKKRGKRTVKMFQKGIFEKLYIFVSRKITYS